VVRAGLLAVEDVVGAQVGDVRPHPPGGVGDVAGAEGVDRQGALRISLAVVDRRPGAGVDHGVGGHRRDRPEDAVAVDEVEPVAPAGHDLPRRIGTEAGHELGADLPRRAGDQHRPPGGHGHPAVARRPPGPDPSVVDATSAGPLPALRPGVTAPTSPLPAGRPVTVA
jgi:hypothetical protein